MGEPGRKLTLPLSEMLEFASFSACEQRYICRSLDIAFGRPRALRSWARSLGEARSIRDQARLYRRIALLKSLAPHHFDSEAAEPVLAPLITMTAFDLAQGGLVTYPAYRFLYERMLGADLRPWLVPAFCAAASLPNRPTEQRIRLLRTVCEDAMTAISWPGSPPAFMPQWIEPMLA